MTSVTTDARSAKGYHHGDLPSALRAATAELITENGPNGFSLREVARRAGVSHAAPAHHFGGSQGLLTSVATEGFQTLVDRFLAAGPIEDPVERLNAMGVAYLSTAVEFPGHFAVMCAEELIDTDDEGYVSVASASFVMLVETVAEIADKLNPELDVDAVALWIWSGVHGLAVLMPGLDDMATKTSVKNAPVQAMIDQFTNFFLNGIVGA